MSKQYETVIGLEVHVELATRISDHVLGQCREPLIYAEKGGKERFFAVLGRTKQHYGLCMVLSRYGSEKEK